MALNCKPGDLAVIVSSVDAKNNGVLVEVIRAMPMCPEYGHIWEVKPLGRAWDYTHKRYIGAGEPGDCQDATMRPIRPQADDAQDESKAWLPPVPTKEHA